jgi:hypothetical protein
LDTQQILKDLKAERDRINQAIAAIEGLTSNDTTPVHPEKPAGKSLAPTAPKKKTRHMSVAARKRIGEAVKARWAAQKKAAAKLAKAD